MKNTDFQLERHSANPILGPHSMPGADANGAKLRFFELIIAFSFDYPLC